MSESTQPVRVWPDNRAGESSSAPAGLSEPSPTRGSAWPRRDVLMVIVIGLAGGVFGGLAGELHYWLQSNTLRFLHSAAILPSLSAFLYQAVGGSIVATHVVFVGLRTRRRFTMLATAAVGAVPLLGIVLLIDPVAFHYPVGSTQVFLAVVYVVVALGLVAGFGELLLALCERLPAGRLASGLPGLAIPAAYTVYYLLQFALPQFGGGTTRGWGPLDWQVWLLLAGGWAFLVSGLVPSALADALRRRAETVARTPAASGGGGAAAAGGPARPAGPEALEHPQATTTLVLGLVGLLAIPPLAPVAWVMGARARAELRQFPGRYRESGALTAGYVLGICGTVLLVLALVALMGMLFVIAAAAPGLR